ncbi:hypothetical protein SAMN04487967_2483 [Natronorubrum sediminis]|uniref:Uncharacterized protein n=1 Tax=Natronorubrum sediminis TaxID=640943 RepID=A0A1H6G154_9EURY|nr:hypothetical protein SAMN04487967_2483 [Natronorubrum sediminis]
MSLSEILNGESMTGKQAATVFFLWLGLVLTAGFLLVLTVP